MEGRLWEWIGGVDRIGWIFDGCLGERVEDGWMRTILIQETR
jgi:hypothetical protein